MALTLLLAAFPHPVSAQSTTALVPSPSYAEAARRVTIAPVVATTAAPHRPDGFGMYAVTGHRTVDLAAPNTWTVNADANVSSTLIGLGWQRNRMSATVGYVRPASGGRRDDPYFTSDRTPVFHARGMVGLGFAVRY